VGQGAAWPLAAAVPSAMDVPRSFRGRPETVAAGAHLQRREAALSSQCQRIECEPAVGVLALCPVVVRILVREFTLEEPLVAVRALQGRLIGKRDFIGAHGAVIEPGVAFPDAHVLVSSSLGWGVGNGATLGVAGCPEVVQPLCPLVREGVAKGLRAWDACSCQEATAVGAQQRHGGSLVARSQRPRDLRGLRFASLDEHV
jgi:hypothetical protein